MFTVCFALALLLHHRVRWLMGALPPSQPLQPSAPQPLSPQPLNPPPTHPLALALSPQSSTLKPSAPSASQPLSPSAPSAPQPS
eukprot:5376474-Prymnesium_polylepis.1